MNGRLGFIIPEVDGELHLLPHPKRKEQIIRRERAQVIRYEVFFQQTSDCRLHATRSELVFLQETCRSEVHRRAFLADGYEQFLLLGRQLIEQCGIGETLLVDELLDCCVNLFFIAHLAVLRQ